MEMEATSSDVIDGPCDEHDSVNEKRASVIVLNRHVIASMTPIECIVLDDEESTNEQPTADANIASTARNFTDMEMTETSFSIPKIETDARSNEKSVDFEHSIREQQCDETSSHDSYMSPLVYDSDSEFESHENTTIDSDSYSSISETSCTSSTEDASGAEAQNSKMQSNVLAKTSEKGETDRNDIVGRNRFKYPSAKGSTTTSLTDRSSLRRQVNGVRTKKAVFQCAECNEVSSQKWHLERHLASKHGMGPFKCTYTDCSKTFASNGDLKRHRNSIHTRECSKCFEVFCYRKSQRIHMLNCQKRR